MYHNSWLRSAVLAVSAASMLAGSAAAYEFNDVQWDARIFPIPYYINIAGAPDDFESIIRQSVTQWHQVASSSMTFAYKGMTTRRADNNDGHNIFLWDAEWEEKDPSVIAETIVRVSPAGIILECDTVFNGTLSWSTDGTPGPEEYDLLSVALREVGRWIQLEYLADPAFSSSVMYSVLEPGVLRRTLSQDDIDGITHVYRADHLADAWEDDDTCAQATVLELNDVQAGHNIYPGTDEDWYSFTVSEPASYRIATSGPDPLGDTELFLYDTCPPGDIPLAHADDVIVPGLLMPSTDSVVHADGSYEFRINISPGVVPIGGLQHYLSEQIDFTIAQGAQSPLNEINTDVVIAVVAVANGGEVELIGVMGDVGTYQTSAPSIAQIQGAVGHSEWVRIGDTRFSQPPRLSQNNVTVKATYNMFQNDDVEFNQPTTPSVLRGDGSYTLRANIVGGNMLDAYGSYPVPSQQDFVFAQGSTLFVDDVNSTIVYAVVGVLSGGSITLVGVPGTAAPPGMAVAPSNSEIVNAVGGPSVAWSRIGHAALSLNNVGQLIEEGGAYSAGAVSPFYAVLDTPGLVPGVTYYVKVQSSTAGGRPIVDPYTISLMPGIYDAYESDDRRENAKRIYPGDRQERSLMPSGDIDWVRFELAEDRRVIIETTGPANGNTQMSLEGLYGNIAFNDDKPEDWYSRIELPTLPADTYWILVTHPAGGELGRYMLELTTLEPVTDLYEPDDSPPEAGLLVELEPQTHTIDPAGDEDWLYFMADEMVPIVEIVTSGLADDTSLELFDDTILTDPQAQPIATDNPGIGYAHIIVNTGLQPGQYFVRVTESGNDAVTGDYQIILVFSKEGDEYEPDDAAALANPILHDQPQEHSLKPYNESDWVWFTLDTSASFTVETYGSEPDSDTVLRLYSDNDGSPVLIDENDDISYPGNLFSKLSYPDAPAGKYYVEVTGWPPDVESYFLKLTVEASQCEDTAGDTPAEAKTIGNNVQDSDPLCPMEDVDWYKIEVAELSDIDIQVAGDALLEVELFNGTILGGSPDASLDYQLGEYNVIIRRVELPAGTYYIKVNEFNQDAVVDEYTILVKVAPAPDFRASLPWLYYEGDWQEPPQPKTVTIRHLSDAVTWSASADVTWLTIEPSNGAVNPSASQDIQVTANIYEMIGGNPSALIIGEYAGTITYQASDGSSYQSEVYLTITDNTPVLQWSTGSLQFSAVEGATEPTPQNVTLQNHGGGTLIQWSIVSDQTWVTIDNGSGTMLSTNPQVTVTVHAHPDGLAPGPHPHTANLILHGFEGSPEPQPAPPGITFTVSTDTTAPTPAVSSFEQGPHGVAGSGAIHMTAVQTTDDQLGPIEFYYEFLGGESDGADSAWTLDRNYSQPGLTPGGYYTFRVKARDTSSQHNETSFSGKASGYVAPAAPPAPVVSNSDFTTMDIVVARGTNSPRVQLAIYNATDDCYVGRNGEPVAQPFWRLQEEWCPETAGQPTPVTATGLRGDTKYSFEIVGRNGQGLQGPHGSPGTGDTKDNAPPSPAPTISGEPQFDGDQVTVTCTESFDKMGVEYYFEFVGAPGEGSDRDFEPERSYTMPETTVPGGQYGFRVRARDGNDPPCETEFSEAVMVYRAPQTPPIPAPTPDDYTDSTVNISLLTGDDNSATVEYAIQMIIQGTGGGWADEHGNRVANEVWQTAEQWGDPITLQGGSHGATFLIAVKARNGAGVESALTSYLSISFVLPNSDTTPPAPNPMKWDAASPLGVTSDSIGLRAASATDNTPPINYEFRNETTGITPAWQQSRDYTFGGLTRSTRYEIRVRAKDGGNHIGDWSDPIVIYTLPNTASAPVLTKDTEGGLKVYVDVHENNNPPETEYAIVLQNKGKYVGADGSMDATGKAWKTRAEWLQTQLQGFDLNFAYSIAVIGRAPDGREAPAGPPLVGMLDFDPPTPNPAVLMTATFNASAEVVLTAGTAFDPGGIEYYFKCTDGSLASSGWRTSATWTFVPPVRALNAPYRVKYRDGFGNESDWSAVKVVPIDPPNMMKPTARGASGQQVFFSISYAPNARTAEYAVEVMYQGAGLITGYLTADGTTQEEPCWRTYDEWGDVIALDFSASVYFVGTFVRRPGGSDIKESKQVELWPGPLDTTPPTPNSSFQTPPAAIGPHSVTMTAAQLSDAQTYVKYGFQIEGGAMVWQWDRTYTHEGLLPAGQYRFRTQAIDGVGNTNAASAYSSVYTHATPPGQLKPDPHALTIDLQIDPAENSAAVEYAIYDDVLEKYVAADGSLTSDTPVWQTIAGWDSPAVVSGIVPRSRHVFSAMARNQDGIVTDNGPSVEVFARDYDDEPPLPNPAEFAVTPVAVSPTSFRAEATVAADASPPIKYYFAVTSPEGDAADSGWQQSNVYQPTGLTPGGRYTITVKAMDSSDSPHTNETQASALASLYLPTVTPGKPVASNTSATSTTLSVSPGTNSSEAVYAVFETRTGRYVDATNILRSLVPVWRSAAEWGGSFAVGGLQGDSSYYFKAASRNKEEIVSAWTAETEVQTESGLLAPDAPTVPTGYAGSRSIKLQINAPGADPATTFAIRCDGTLYVQIDGSLAASAVWQTLDQWQNPAYIKGLTPDTTYLFDVQAKLDDASSEWSTATAVLTNIQGDVNGDNKVNIVDMLAVRNVLNRDPKSDSNFRADVDGDGKINIVDMLAVRNSLNTSRQ